MGERAEGKAEVFGKEVIVYGVARGAWRAA